MRTVEAALEGLFRAEGVSLFGFADLRALPIEQRDGFDYGISIALSLDKNVISGIADGPTHAYYENYDHLNARLDALALKTEEQLKDLGFRAQANTRERINCIEEQLFTKLPHKTVATRAGLGWIGKCALLVTQGYGSAVRLTSVLTNAHLNCADPIDESYCDECTNCADVCPANAVSGKLWYAGLPREEFWDASACRNAARTRSWSNLHEQISLCGLCILHCPYTQAWLRRSM